MKIREIEIDKIIPDLNQPRKIFENIGKLSDSILKDGLIQPIEVIPNTNQKGTFKIIDGERRYRAVKLLKTIKNISCIIKDVDEIKDIFLRQAITDFQKQKLNTVEQAEIVGNLIKNDYSINEICHRLSIGTGTYYFLKKVNNYSLNTKQKIIEGKLPAHVVRRLSVHDLKNN